MAKLIRINTDDDSGIFNETFNEDLVIEKDSTIALQSSMFTRQLETFTKTHNNQKFRFGTKGVVLRDMIIFNIFTIVDSVDTTNIDDFLLDLQSSINMTLCPFGYVGQGGNNDRGGLYVISQRQVKAQHDSGTQCQVFINNATNKVNMNVKRQAPLKWTSDINSISQLFLNNANVNRTGATPTLEKIDYDPDGAPDGVASSCFAIDNKKAGIGGSYFSAKVQSFSNMTDPQEFTTPPSQALPNGVENGAYSPVQEGQSGFIMGLVDSDGVAKIQNGDFTPEQDFYAYVGLKNNTANPYFYGYGSDTLGAPDDISFPTQGDEPVADGVFKYYSTRTYEAADKVGIAITLGQIKFFLGRANGDNEAFLNKDVRPQRMIDYKRDYYYVVCLLGQDDKITLSEIEAVNSPFEEDTVGITQVHLGSFLSAPQTLGVVPHPAAENQFNQAQFGFEYRLEDGTTQINSQLRDFLGFEDNILNSESIDAHTHEFIADNTVDYLTRSETFIVLLNNIPLQAYDTEEYGGKKNILYTIVQQRDIQNKSLVLFNSQYPIYLDMNNKNDLSLRHIQARIVDSRYNPIRTAGISSMTLLIKPKN